jgi:hypothetical protein
MALSNAERSRRKRERAKLLAAAATVDPASEVPVETGAFGASPDLDVEAAMREFLELSAAWSDQQTTTQGQNIALKALKALDGVEDKSEEASLRRFAHRQGIPGAWRTVEDRARRKAVDMIQARTVDLRAGRATAASINSGLAAVAELKKRRAQFDASAVDTYLARALIGGPAPAHLTDSRVNDEMPDETDVYTHSYEGTQP